METRYRARTSPGIRRIRWIRRIRPLAPLGLAAVLATAAAAAADWQPVVDGVARQHVVRDGIDAHVVRVDVANPNLRVVTSRASERGLTVSEFARRTSAIVAINGDYFDHEMRPFGLAMGACGVWGEAMRAVRRQEVLGVGAGRARIFPRQEPLRTPEPWMTGAVSGWPAIVADCDPVERLPGSDPFTHAPHPRTAVGLSADGRELFLVVADGRREDAPGLTLPELANLMDEMGACSAVNLDGGGSSAMWIGGRIVNRPSDGIERSVVNHLAVVATEEYAGCVASPGDAQ